MWERKVTTRGDIGFIGDIELFWHSECEKGSRFSLLNWGSIQCAHRASFYYKDPTQVGSSKGVSTKGRQEKNWSTKMICKDIMSIIIRQNHVWRKYVIVIM